MKKISLFKTSVLIMILKVFLSYSIFFKLPSYIDNFVAIFASSLLAILLVVKHKYSKLTLTLYALISILAFYTCYVVKDWMILISVITILSIKDKKIDDVIEFIFRNELIILILHLIACICISVFIHDKSLFSTVNGVVCFNYGFTHPNVSGIIISNLLFMWIWLNYYKLNKTNMLIVFIIGLVSYITSNSRGAFYTLLVLIALILIPENNRFTKKITQKGALFSVPFFSVSVYILASLYIAGNRIAFILDAFMTSRIRFTAYNFSKSGITLFGQYLDKNITYWDSEWLMNSVSTFDNVYGYLMGRYGFVWLILISWGFYLIAKNNNKRNNVMILIWAIYGLGEGSIINCFLSFPLLFLSQLLTNRKKAL